MVKNVDQLDYSRPIVDHAFARERALQVFRKALNE